MQWEVLEQSSDFSIALTANQSSVSSPGTATYTIGVSPSNGFNGGAVNLAVSGLPAGVGYGFSANGQTTSSPWYSTLTLTLPAGMKAATCQITVTGTSGSTVHTATAPLTVNGPDWTIHAAPTSPAQSPPIVTAGGTATYSITMNPVNGYSGSVDLSNWQPPAGVTVTLGPTVAPGQPAVLTIATSSNTPSGWLAIPVQATDGTMLRYTSACMCVGDCSGEDDGTPAIEEVIESQDGLSIFVSGENLGSGSGINWASITPNYGSCYADDLEDPNGFLFSCSSPMPAGEYTIDVTIYDLPDFDEEQNSVEWEGPLPGPEDQNCAIQNQIIAEYPQEGVTDSSKWGNGAPWVPQCAWFSQTAQSFYYNSAQLGNFGKQPYAWALVKNPLTVDKSSGYGLDYWTFLLWQYGWAPGTTEAQIIDSTYRDPVYNLNFSKHTDSRHQFGDAVDVKNVSGSQGEHDAKACLASKAGAYQFGGVVQGTCSNPYDADAYYVEPLNEACKSNCVHADWRNRDYNVYNQ